MAAMTEGADVRIQNPGKGDSFIHANTVNEGIPLYLDILFQQQTLCTVIASVSVGTSVLAISCVKDFQLVTTAG